MQLSSGSALVLQLPSGATRPPHLRQSPVLWHGIGTGARLSVGDRHGAGRWKYSTGQNEEPRRSGSSERCFNVTTHRQRNQVNFWTRYETSLQCQAGQYKCLVNHLGLKVEDQVRVRQGDGEGQPSSLMSQATRLLPGQLQKRGFWDIRC
ncbi:hypothetical protein DPEC_G00298670 [Dallia pectoralis]|uniref:Uncharacterized protein n=1 Tax=Dallia pectoralis TaxID=75939 RepID=A0ACC2FG00_DALPE|nr:hypothetical protein DPEC_G00298670 [Dallia pectoralis]